MCLHYLVVHFDVLGGYLGQRFFGRVTQTSLDISKQRTLLLCVTGGWRSTKV